MPYVNKDRPYKKEYAQQKARGEHENRMERQRARRKLDAKGISRKGKDVAHVKALSKGGTSKLSNLRAATDNANRSFSRTKTGDMKSQISKRERKK